MPENRLENRHPGNPNPKTDHLKATRWQAGQSGNPGGRPKKLLVDQVLEELLLAEDSRAAREIALALIQRAKAGDVKAAQFIAERTEGKPRQKLGRMASRSWGTLRSLSFTPRRRDHGLELGAGQDSGQNESRTLCLPMLSLRLSRQVGLAFSYLNARLGEPASSRASPFQAPRASHREALPVCDDRLQSCVLIPIWGERWTSPIWAKGKRKQVITAVINS